MYELNADYMDTLMGGVMLKCMYYYMPG